MRIKRIVAASLITFLLGGVCGSAYAYVAHSSRGGSGQLALPLNLEQAHENWEVEQFISEQEDLRPDGLNEAKIAAGSKYTGVTYKNGKMVMPQKTADVVTADVKQQSAPEEEVSEEETDKTDKKESLLSKILGKKDAAETEQKEAASGLQQTGRIAIQSGSLNVRAQSNTSSEIIGQVYKDDQVQIIGQTGVWYQVITQDGLQGYVSATYVEVIEENK